MEPHAVIAAWQRDGSLTLYHSKQGVSNSRERVATLLGLPKEKVRIVSRYVGGGFGTKGSTWPHVTLTAMAARAAQRPVKLVLTRRQMYSSNGFRSKTIQRLRIDADRSGRLLSLRHDSQVHTAIYGEFAEPCGLATESSIPAPMSGHVPHRAHQCRYPDLYARARQGERHGRARGGYGRACLCCRRRSPGAAPCQPCRPRRA